MRKAAWAPLMFLSGCMLPPLLLAGDSGARAHLIGGTVSSLPSKSEGNFNLTDGEAFLFRSKGVTLRIPYNKINVLEYGQRVDRRYLEAIVISPFLLLSKKRKHYLTVGYTDESGRQQALVFQVDKSGIRSVLAGLEAKSGRKVEFQDEQARKAGKG